MLNAEMEAVESKTQVHFWDSFAPEQDLTFTQCGRIVPYGDGDRIVLWAEKEATCDDCIAISAAKGGDRRGLGD